MAKTDADKTEFESASQERELSLLGEIIEFIVEYKKWWLIPIVLSLGFIGLLALLALSGVAPFIYTLF